eukprot:364002-Chlamydomonas_euryale.AAC.8
MGSKGMGSKGMGSRGMDSKGMGSKGMGSKGMGSKGMGSKGMGSKGMGSKGMGSKAPALSCECVWLCTGEPAVCLAQISVLSARVLPELFDHFRPWNGLTLGFRAKP